MAEEATVTTLVDEIHTAVTENKDKEATILRVLGSRSLAERQEVVKAYKEAKGKNLADYFSCSSSNYDRFVHRLCLTRIENAAFWLKDATPGWFFTDERAALGLLITYTDKELEELKTTYNRLCDRRSPSDDVRRATSSGLRVLLLALIDKKSQIDDDADGMSTMILAATEAQCWGVNAEQLCSAVTSGPREFIRDIFEEVKTKGTREITFDKLVQAETSGWLRTGLLMLYEWAYSPTKFYATELYQALIGGFTVNHAALRNYIVDRSEIDLPEIAKAYEEKYERSLKDAVMDRVSGPYLDLVLEVMKPKNAEKTELDASDAPPGN